MTRVHWPLVTVDLDGMLTLRHGWETIADHLGRRTEFDTVNRRYLAGEVNEDDHLTELLGIATGARWPDVEGALEATPRLESIPEGIARLRSAGRRVALLTHNPAYIADWYVARFGFDDLECTRAQVVQDGIVRPPGAVRAGKKEGIRRLAARAGVTLAEVVHVGDGAADAALFPMVGRGIALNATSPEVQAAADVVLRTEDFLRVVKAIEGLRPRK